MASTEQDGSTEPEPLLGFVPRALDGDAAALRALLSALAPEVTRVARTMIGSSAPELDDVVQEALLGLLHALPTFRGECSLRRFANRIAVRTALLARRRGRARTERQEKLHASGSVGLVHPDAASRPDEQYVAAQRHALLRELLDALPEAQAETLALRVVLGLSLEETAAETGVPVNTVRSRVRLAREALRDKIDASPELLELLQGER